MNLLLVFNNDARDVDVSLPRIDSRSPRGSGLGSRHDYYLTSAASSTTPWNDSKPRQNRRRAYPGPHGAGKCTEKGYHFQLFPRNDRNLVTRRQTLHKLFPILTRLQALPRAVLSVKFQPHRPSGTTHARSAHQNTRVPAPWQAPNQSAHMT